MLALGDVQLTSDEVNRRTSVEVGVKVVEVGNQVAVTRNGNPLVKTQLHLGQQGNTSCEEAEEDCDDSNASLVAEDGRRVLLSNESRQPAFFVDAAERSSSVATGHTGRCCTLDFGTRETVCPTSFHALLVQRKHCNKHGNLQQGIDEDGTSSVSSKVAHGRHTDSRSQRKRNSLRQGRKQDRGTHATQSASNTLFRWLIGMADVHSFELMNDQEDVVHTHSQYQERNNFGNDERSLHADSGKQADAGRDGHEDNQNANHAEEELALHESGRRVS